MKLNFSYISITLQIYQHRLVVFMIQLGKLSPENHLNHREPLLDFRKRKLD